MKKNNFNFYFYEKINQSINQSIFLTLLFGALGFSSCQDQGQEISELDVSNLIEVEDSKFYEKKLKELSIYMGEVFKDKNALKELFELSEIDDHKDDIRFSLKNLFDQNENPLTRKKSYIVDAFYKNAANHRIGEVSIKPNELISFIKTYDISILAPYMVGYFHPDSIQELTISWWTKEIENAGFDQDPNWVGKTPGYRFKLDQVENFLQFRTNGDSFSNSEEVMSGDDYAIENPTIVLGDFEEGFPDDGDEVGGTNNDPVFPIQNSARCDDLTNSSVVRLTMPKFRLTSSIRAWPHPDRMTVVVVLGTNPGGSAYENRPFFEVEVTRGAAKDQRWIESPSSFLVNNWQNRQIDLAFVVFNRRPWSGKEEYNAVVKIKTDESGNTNTEITQELTIGGWQRSQVHGNATFNRCGTIIDPFRDKGFGTEFHDGKSYGVERLNKFDFILVPEITL